MNKALLHQLKNYGSKSIGFILFLICAVSIYNKVASNENLHQISDDIKAQLATIAVGQWLFLIALFILNYLMEAIKWKLVVEVLHPINMLQSFKSVLVGQAFAFFTPVRTGDYVGRILFLEAGNKLKGVTQMAWASFAQLLITLFFGSLGVFLNLPFWPWLHWVAPLIALVAIFIYFHPGNFKGWLKKLTPLQITTQLKIQLIFFSFLKYCIFMLQYFWVVTLLDLPIAPINLMGALAVLFFCLSIIPAIALTDLVIRGQLIVVLLSPFYANSLMLICLSTIIWAVNFLLPSIIGSILLLNYRIKQ